VEDLKRHLLHERAPSRCAQPRWIRINTLKTSLVEELSSSLQGYATDATITEVTESTGSAKILAIDRTIPDVVAVPFNSALTKTPAYEEGRLILQDKASCFPAYLLAGGQDGDAIGDCIDGCAAPGNKTSHLAALLGGMRKSPSQIYACERDPKRSQTLQKMMEKSGARNVTVLPRQDFLALSPNDPRFKHVTHVLLDPSCSGSGIIGREDVPELALPVDPQAEKRSTSMGERYSKKRKTTQNEAVPIEVTADPTEVEELKDVSLDETRLQRLSAVQTKIIEHALSFPATIRVTYSTCSVHVEENESVVSRVLMSDIARSRGWRVLRREEQPRGLREWKSRGISNPDTSLGGLETPALSPEECDACIRCNPGDEEGTMGFFVCGFVRSSNETDITENLSEDHGAWEGFSD